MKQIAFERRKLAANFFANIGVAWFASGVIGIFINQMTDQYVLELDRKKK